MKNLFKAAFAVAAVAAVGMGSYKAYGSYVSAYMSEEDLLFAENVMALSDAGDNRQVPVISYPIKGYCWAKSPTSTNCSNRKDHGDNCKIIGYTVSSTPRTLWTKGYMKQKDFKNSNVCVWQDSDGYCDQNTNIFTTTNQKPANDPGYHTYEE